MTPQTIATIAATGTVTSARAIGAATFAGRAGAMWPVVEVSPSYVVNLTDDKHRGRWPEEVASHR